ncbi:MAG: GNAT family N-acetyltransferase [Saprospiraceae bacterium]|nr:GNAT family N-acetyltransferase [Saprospiraceae bacterium]
MQLSFLRLDQQHLEPAFEVIIASRMALAQNGIDQWDEVYPNKEHIHTDIINGHAFGGFIGGDLVAYVAINDWADPEYDRVNWSFHVPSLIVHRLVVHPMHQGKGLAKQMMHNIYDFARGNEYNSIRLDAFCVNEVSNKLYESLGYKNAGTIMLRKGKFFCYEIGI